MERQVKISIYICILLVLLHMLQKIRDKSLYDDNPVYMIKKDNYPVEVHIIETEDDYLLTIHRIPRPPGSIPVYLQHGLLFSSAEWMKNGKGRSLPYILWEQGYDVWIGNARGNTYSKGHKTLSISDKNFWNFTWHQLGFYDIPAVITYIANKTNNKIFYVGHSMGVSTFSIMATERPIVAKNVRAMIALAPAPYEYHIRQPLLRIVSHHWRTLQSISDTVGIYEFFGRNIVFDIFANYICTIPYAGNVICSNLMFFLFGYNPDQLDYTKLSSYFSTMPAGTSIKLFYHWLQHMTENEFRNFDYGTETNLKVYNSPEPSKYDITKIHVPIAVFLSDNDLITDSIDVRHFYEQVPYKLGLYDIGYSFSHGDFIWGNNATEIIYHKIVEIFKTAENLDAE